MSMVQRVAAEIYGALFLKLFEPPEVHPERTAACVSLARQIIKAMREPTEAMDEDVTRGAWWDDCTAAEIWRNMIDNCLKDEP